MTFPITTKTTKMCWTIRTSEVWQTRRQPRHAEQSKSPAPRMPLVTKRARREMIPPARAKRSEPCRAAEPQKEPKDVHDVLKRAVSLKACKKAEANYFKPWKQLPGAFPRKNCRKSPQENCCCRPSSSALDTDKFGPPKLPKCPDRRTTRRAETAD